MLGRWGGQPYGMFIVRKGNMYNWSMVDDPKIDDYYYPKTTAAYFDVAKREAIVKQMNIDVIHKAYYIVRPGGYTWHFWWPWVKNYSGEQGFGVSSTYWQKYVWLDQSLKKSMGY